MFKVNNELSLEQVSENFHITENHYNFRHTSKAKNKIDSVKLKNMANICIIFRTQVWNSIPQEMKEFFAVFNSSVHVGLAESLCNLQVLSSM